MDYELSVLHPPGVSSEDVVDDVMVALVDAADNGTLLDNANVDSTSFVVGDRGESCIQAVRSSKGSVWLASFV